MYWKNKQLRMYGCQQLKNLKNKISHVLWLTSCDEKMIPHYVSVLTVWIVFFFNMSNKSVEWCWNLNDKFFGMPEDHFRKLQADKKNNRNGCYVILKS